jgi:hypothetical protein
MGSPLDSLEKMPPLLQMVKRRDAAGPKRVA